MYAITRCFSGHYVSLNCPLLSSLAIYFSSSRLFCHIGCQTRFPVPVLPLAKPSSNHHNTYFPKVGCSPCHPVFKTLHNSPLFTCHAELTLPFSLSLCVSVCLSPFASLSVIWSYLSLIPLFSTFSWHSVFIYAVPLI